eukprot:1161876-Pelagomonas_calceolata.AAC.4
MTEVGSRVVCTAGLAGDVDSAAYLPAAKRIEAWQIAWEAAVQQEGLINVAKHRLKKGLQAVPVHKGRATKAKCLHTTNHGSLGLQPKN